jgi:hypothetical protein
MFKSLLGTQKGHRSERTPLLAALDRYRNRNADGDDSASEGGVQDNGPDDMDDEHYDEDDDDDDHRDGPLLPVFSSEVLGILSYATTKYLRR